ncbi:hypothetical protein C482_15563 [Natrialba chahannaoensis JCM 10990]|uniref:Cadherin domain-containing protein n=1 Tax=Natrialba chahannaoensis JCM 10990 TaxID=1227492 RepID=M0AFC1_9EURY|nr:BGTF surface domain-containing protein [Natrialba chahannaoensis]ELY96557.1 hypothetical protein C482_15563 [Natrialba chahannaoensis JCM 10990]
MTNETTFREKGRALFLAAMMVLSVVAMSAAVAGAAAAINDEQELDQGPVAYDDEGDQTIEVVFEGDVGDVTSDEITVEDRNGDEVDWEVESSDNNVLILEPEDSDQAIISSGTLEIDWDDDTVEYDIEVTSTLVEDPGDTEEEEEEEESVDAYYGENVAIVGDEGDTVDIYSDDESITRGLGDNSEVRTLDTGDDRWDGADNITVDFESGGEVTLELDDLGLGIETDEDSYWDSNTVEATAEADDIERPVEFTLLDDDGDDLNTTEGHIGSDGEAVGEFNLSQIDDVDHENYTIEVEDLESGVTAESDEFSVEEEPDGDILFDDSYNVALGNNAEVVVNIDNYDGPVYVQVGDVEEFNYQTVLEVEDDSDSGNVTIVVDTTELGDGEDAYSVLDDDDSFDHINTMGAAEAPLETTHGYSLTVGVDEDGENVTAEEDASSLYLEDREPMTDVYTETAPDGDDLDDDDTVVTATDEIAFEDSLLATIEAQDMFAIVEEDDDASELADAGLNVSITEADPGANVEATTWSNVDGNEDFSDGGIEVVEADEDNGTITLAIDYEDLLEEDESYKLNITYEDDEFLDDDEEEYVTTEFDLVEPELELSDANEALPNSDSAEVTGTTNVAPGTTVEIRAAAPQNFHLDPDETPEVDADGDFVGIIDFSEYEAGIEMELTADVGLADDEMDAELEDADEAIINLEADAPSEVDVGDEATLDVTVSNTGGTSDEVEIGIVVNGENEVSENVTLDPDESWSDSVTFTSDSEGDVEWSVVAGDNEDSGATTFSDADDDESDTDESDESDADEDESDTDESDDDGDDDGDDDDGTPGFGVAVALAALLGAAMLALRKQN